MEVFDTHKFLYSLVSERGLKGIEVVYLDNEMNEQTITLSGGDIGNKPISCKLYDTDGNLHVLAYVKIKQIYDGEELIWDAGDNNLSNLNIIESYKKRERKGEIK